MKAFYLKVSFMKKLTFLSLSLISLLSVSSLEGIAAGIKDAQLGSAGVAYCMDSLSAALNPAVGVDVEDRFDIGVFGVYEKGDATVKDNLVLTPDGPILNPFTNGKFDAFYSSKWLPSVSFGLNYNLSCNSAIGIVVYNRNAQKTTYKNPNLLLGNTPVGLEYINETVSPYYSYKWGRNNFGISLNWQIARLKVDGLENFDNPLFSLAPGAVTNRGYNYSNGLGVTLGWQFHLTDNIELGFAWTPKTRMSRFGKYRGFSAEKGRVDIPERYNAGFAWRFITCATLVFEYENERWSGTPSIHNILQPTLLDSITNKLGSHDGSGFGWKNKNSYRFGIDYAFNEEWNFRIGFGRVTTGVRRTQTALNVLTDDVAQNFLTGGATWQITCRDDLSLFGGVRFKNKIKGKNSIPEFLGGGNVDLTETKAGVAIAWGRRY